MIEVRRTTVDDWQTWRELRLNALRLAPTAFGETYARALAGDEQYWQGWWSKPHDVAMRSIAFVDGQPAGMIGCIRHPDPSDDPEVISMWVEERFRGQGIADALLRDAYDWAAELGCQRMELGVTDGNETARKLYLRHGFTPTGEREVLISHPDLTCERMARPL